MTQQELARAVGMPQPSIARIESGTVTPRTSTLTAILAATGHRLAIEPLDPAANVEAIRQQLALAVPKRTRDAIGKAAGDPRTTPIRILRRLRRFGVPFILIGELAEAVHGSPLPLKVARVIEICHARTETADERLAMALDDLRAKSPDGLEFKTDAGRLHLVAETAAGDDYGVLARNAVGMRVDAGLLVRVAAIEDLIQARVARCTDEDRAASAVLRAVADEVNLRSMPALSAGPGMR